MDGFLLIAIMFVAFTVLGIAALTWGVDSRIGYGDPDAHDAGLSA